MRNLVATFGRYIAAFVMLALLNSSIAMAAYVCPKAPAGMATMATGLQTQGMDEQMPVHCAEHHTGDKQALEQSGAPAELMLPQVVFVQPLPAASSPIRHPLFVHAVVPAFPAHAPPFLRTQRLRI